MVFNKKACLALFLVLSIALLSTAISLKFNAPTVSDAVIKRPVVIIDASHGGSTNTIKA